DYCCYNFLFPFTVKEKMKPSSPRVGNSSARNDGDAHALLLNLWLASPQVLNLIRGNKVDDNLVQRLKNTLYAVEAVFNDADTNRLNGLMISKMLSLLLMTFSIRFQ
ncbi:hypothetical protein KIW84_015385, partial [Lathyrus oleraceus]